MICFDDRVTWDEMMASPLVVSRSYCDTRLDLALSSDDNNIPHFIWTTKCQNQWFCKYHSQLLYCSEIVLRKWNTATYSPKSGLYTFFVFCFLLIIEATLNIAWFVSSRTTSTNLDICKTNIRNPAQNPCQFIFLSSQTSLMLCTKLFLMCCQWKFHLVLTNFQFVAIDSNEDKLFKDRAYFCNIFQFYLLTNIYISLLIMWTAAGLIKNLPFQLFSLFLGMIFTLTSFSEHFVLKSK